MQFQSILEHSDSTTIFNNINVQTRRVYSLKVRSDKVKVDTSETPINKKRRIEYFTINFIFSLSELPTF